jgi:hypothetical protein
MTPDPFLADIEAEYHSDLLSRGNFPPQRKSSLWTGENSWTHTGYEAHVEELFCSRCAHQKYFFKGLFSVETAPSGARRFQVLDPLRNSVPLSHSGKWPTKCTRLEVPYCTSCLPLDFS